MTSTSDFKYKIVEINEPSTSKAADMKDSGPRNKRKIALDEDAAASAICNSVSSVQVQRFIRSLKRKSAVVFVYKCRETLQSMMPIETRPTYMPMTPAPAPTQPDSKRKKLIFRSSKLAKVAQRGGATRPMVPPNGNIDIFLDSSYEENPVDKISHLFGDQLKIKDSNFEDNSAKKP